MRVVALRRYPVKGMAGQELARVTVDARGLEWDRWYAVVDADGRFATGKDSRRFRRREAVLTYTALGHTDGVRVVRDGAAYDVGGRELDDHLSEVVGDRVQVLPEGDVPHQDASAVSLVGTASLEWCAARWGDAPDPRRMRVNITVATEEPFVEETWVGGTIAVGSARLYVAEPTPRCRMLDIEQDGVAPAARWLKPLTQERDMNLGVYLDVAHPGEIALGDEVRPPGAG